MLGTRARQFHVGLDLCDAINRDLLQYNARIGAGREVGFSTRMNF